MNSAKPLQWASIALGLSLALYVVYINVQYFSDISVPGALAWPSLGGKTVFSAV
jgi:hypothetical protein